MEEETAEATSTSDPELTVTPAVTPTADPEPTVTPTVTPTPVPKINVKWTGEKWVSRSSVNVTLQVDANGACYYKAAARKKDEHLMFRSLIWETLMWRLLQTEAL